MATIKAEKDIITGGGNYVPGSLIVKSHDDCGIVLKWLETNGTTADRKECFIELDETEAGISEYDDRTAVSKIDLTNPR